MKIRNTIGFILLSLYCQVGFCQLDFKIITSDVLNFWQAYDSLKTGNDPIAIFQRNVIDKATPEFKIFIKQRNITAKHYARQLKAYPKFYASTRANSLKLIQNENEIRELVQKFRDIYPGLVPADIVIAFGNFATGGTVSVSGKDKYMYIGLEYHGLDSSTNTSELNTATRDYVSRSNFFRTIIHELVHVQQASHGKKVLNAYAGDKLANAVLKEGIPEFIASLIYDEGNTGNHFTYGMTNENALIKKLESDLWEKDLSYWIYNSSTVGDQPRDLGYFMGARIAESYYKHNFTTVQKTIREIIEPRDLKDFIKRSKYFKK